MRKLCKKCAQQFEITAVDLIFYEKVSPVFGGKKYLIPAPTLCPDCRQQRRLAFRNEKHLYNRKCDLCQQQIISIFSPDKELKVYCNKCWWSDQWDAAEYGKEIDPEKTFFMQFQELSLQVPKLALNATFLENSPYVHQSWHLKNSHLSFNSAYCENLLYCNQAYHSSNAIDCLTIRYCENVYRLVDAKQCHTCSFLQDCSSCNNAYFSYDCRNCTNIAFCSNLRNKTNYIFNKPVSEIEFKNFKQKFLNGSYQLFMKCYENYKNLLKNALRKADHNIQCENCLGDRLINCKDCFMCFDGFECQDLRYCSNLDEKVYSVIDTDFALLLEKGRENMSVTGNNVSFSYTCWQCSDLLYCHNMNNSNNCFGCIGLQNKQYCILNKQYTKDKYEELVPKLMDRMKKNNELGEFFPVSMTYFGYNESYANECFPLSEDECMKAGFHWKETSLGNKYEGEKTQLPDKIQETDENVVSKILECIECRKNYKIIHSEFAFYKKNKLPIPRTCFHCRFMKMFQTKNPMKIYDRKCYKCSLEIKTTYAPDRPEKVYCEKCYLAEVY